MPARQDLRVHAYAVVAHPDRQILITEGHFGLNTGAIVASSSAPNALNAVAGSFNARGTCLSVNCANASPPPITATTLPGAPPRLGFSQRPPIHEMVDLGTRLMY
jgi:hypothetical protein